MKKKTVKTKSKGGQKGKVKKVRYTYPLSSTAAVIGVSVITFLLFLAGTGNDFVSWDDPSYVIKNMCIQHFDVARLIEMFDPFPKNYLVSNYHPLTELSLAFDHMLFGLDPAGYHLTNVIFHTINTVLVFFIILRLTKGRVLAAAITALLFGVHPMRVESVVWIAERKDVLHVFFYLLAIFYYLRHIGAQEKTKKYIGLTLLFFICSLLSKAQAVTLPIALLLIDYLTGRNDLKKILIEKVPFLLLSLIFGLLAIKAQHQSASLDLVEIPYLYRPFTASFALLRYFGMLIAPVGMAALHPYPFDAGSSPPPYIYASIVVMLAFLGGLYMAWKKEKKVIVFGLAFFFMAILPVLQFLTVGEALFAERYTYLPYLGLFFIAGYYVDKIYTEGKTLKYRKIPLYVSIFASAIFAYISYSEISTWKNSNNLWTNVLDKYPNSKTAYVNLSYFYSELKDYDKTIEYADKGIKIAPDHHKLWVNKAFGLMQKGQHQAAIPILKHALKLDSTQYSTTFNLGVCYNKLKQYEVAFDYMNKTIQLEPDHIDAFFRRGVIYSDIRNEQEKAIADFKRVIEVAPTHGDALLNLSLASYKGQFYPQALEYANRAVNAAPNEGKAYYIRALIYQALNQPENAQRDSERSKQLGYK